MTNEPSTALAGRVIIVTGASRGIGRAIAMRLATDGGKVVLAARDASSLTKVAEEIAQKGGTAAAFPADLRQPEAPASLAEAAIRTFGKIDGVVNNAGATKHGDFLELSEADWTDGFALKFFATVRLSRAAWPHLKKTHGSVLNIIGTGGRTPGASFTIGGSVDWRVRFRLPRRWRRSASAMACRLRTPSIPDWVRTDRLRHLLEKEAAEHGGNLDAAADEVARKANIVRMGEPVDVANLAAYVLSPQARLLQGAMIDLDGGMTKTI